jgi:hypothetical protein
MKRRHHLNLQVLLRNQLLLLQGMEMAMVKAMDPLQRRNQLQSPKKKGAHLETRSIVALPITCKYSNLFIKKSIISTPAKKKARMSVGSTPKNALIALDGKGTSTAPKGSKSTAKKAATPGASAAAKKRKIEELEKDVRYIKTLLFSLSISILSALS